MPATKVKDIAVKTGEYQKDGQTKGRYENIGSIFKSDDGGTFLLMKRTFNLAGLPQDGRDNALLSCFEPRDDQQGGNNGNRQRRDGGSPSAKPNGQQSNRNNRQQGNEAGSRTSTQGNAQAPKQERQQPSRNNAAENGGWPVRG